MGALELIQQYEFLGKEFLTYLWYIGESNQGVVELKNDMNLEIYLEKNLCLESEFGDVKKTTLSGDDPSVSREAKTALSEGKQLSRAKFKMIIDNIEWHFSLDAKTLDLKSVQIPKVSGPSEDSILIYRIKAFEKFAQIIDGLFFTFMRIRIDDNKWGLELVKIKQWINS